MRSTFGGLNAVVRGLYAQQMSLDTVGHNISNASTEGYSRQRVNMSTTTPEQTYGSVGQLQIGTGVNVESIKRVRDAFMDQQIWKENSSLGYGTTAQNMLNKIEDIFHDEPGNLGVQTVLDNFWDSLQTLMANGSNDSARKSVRQRGQEMVDSIQHAREQLNTMVTDVNKTLELDVKTINQMTSDIVSLNKQISNIEVDSKTFANDLRDKRDLLVDKLSKMIDVRVYEDPNHNYIVSSAGVTIAGATSNTPLALNAPATANDPQYGFAVRWVVTADTKQNMNFTSGELRALQETNRETVQNYLGDLATISQFLLKDFNQIHRAGYGSDNSTGINFFGQPGVDYSATPPTTNGGWLDALVINPQLFNADGTNKIAAKTAEVKSVTQSNSAAGKATVSGTYTPAGSTAYQNYVITVTSVTGGVVDGISYTINGGAPVVIAAPAAQPFNLGNGLQLSIATDPDTLVGNNYSFSVPQDNASGDNATLLSNALKKPSAPTSVLHGVSLDEYYGSMIAGLGVDTQSMTRMAANQQNIVDQIENWRQGVAGVNTDEEMANMIKFQKAYNAAARVVTTMDEMFDKLINGMGTVGR